MKKPFLGWTKDQKVLDEQRKYYGNLYNKWYRKLWRLFLATYKRKEI